MVNASALMSAVILTSATAVATALLILLLKPLMVRYALARPNARSSHQVPTPQGGGIAIVMVVAIVVALLPFGVLPGFAVAPLGEPWVINVLAAISMLAVVGALDDIQPLGVLPRLLLQFGAAILLVLAVPDGARILSKVAPGLPLPIEQALLVFGLVWFINLTNFMDGIDFMTIVEAAPVCVALSVLGLSGLSPSLAAVLPVILALLGGLIGFAPFNRHVAKLFLGDVGSLPIGALLGWLLIRVAGDGFLATALILPMYYLADATTTLLRRLMNGERFWMAHRSHFYQIATTRGLSVPEVTTRVFALNVFLALMAAASVIARDTSMKLGLVAVSVIATSLILREFARGRLR